MGLVEEAHNVNVLRSGRYVVVLGHGFETDQSIWRHLVPHLLDDYRIPLFGGGVRVLNMRQDIALSIMQTIFEIDTRPILWLVTAPCHILQRANDMAVLLVVSEYLQQNLAGKSNVEVMESEGQFPQLSAPDMVIPGF